MKKTLIFLFIPLFSFSQKNEIEVNALKWFKSVYVENSFKDPYSFKLLKISSKAESLIEQIRVDVFEPIKEAFPYLPEWNDTTYIRTNLEIYQSLFEKTKINNSNYEDVKKKLDVYKTLYETSVQVLKLGVKKSRIIVRYLISIDCYANNSYGNKILGRYSFYYYPKNSKLYKSSEIYSYPDFMIDENSIIKVNKD